MMIYFSVSVWKVVSDPVNGNFLSSIIPVIVGMGGLFTLKFQILELNERRAYKVKYLLRTTPPAHSFSDNFQKL